MDTSKKKTDTLLRKGPTKKYSMTASEFSAIEPLLKNVSPERIRAARLVLVDNQTYEAAANAIGLGWSRQAVGDCIKTVRRAADTIQAIQAAKSGQEVPEGYQQVTLVVPKELIESFYEQIAAFKADK